MGQAFNSLLVEIMLFLTLLRGIVIARHFQHPRANNYARTLDILRNTSIITETESKVNVTIYYETHCPYCINFFRRRLGPTVEMLSSRMNIHMVPYGNAKTTYNYQYGQYIFKCQHGAIECYGNKIHACAIEVLQNNTKAALFNTCLMTETYSFVALDNVLTSCFKMSSVIRALLLSKMYAVWGHLILVFYIYRQEFSEWLCYKSYLHTKFQVSRTTCGAKFHIQTNDIRECVNGERGLALLRSYGDQTRAVRLHGVPCLMLDGEPSDFLEYDLCRLLTPTPRVCISTFGSIFS